MRLKSYHGMNATKFDVIGCNFFVEVEGCSVPFKCTRSCVSTTDIGDSSVVLLEDSDRCIITILSVSLVGPLHLSSYCRIP